VKRCSVGSVSVFPHEIFIFSAKRIAFFRFHLETGNAKKNPINPVNPVQLKNKNRIHSTFFIDLHSTIHL